ncbi:hypothetical protein FWH09_00350 [Candidatus Saccharibacteria bacterium]|nr:hypothetical protein [Candidatus Saccharibacteria bacterium]
MDKKKDEAIKQNTVNQYGRKKLEQLQKISIIFIMVAVLILIGFGIYGQYRENSHPRWEMERQLSVGFEGIWVVDMFVPRRISTEVYRRVEEFVLTEEERATAPHENIHADGVSNPETYWTARIVNFRSPDNLDESATEIEYEFSVYMSDGRVYSVWFKTDRERARVLGFRITPA